MNVIPENGRVSPAKSAPRRESVTPDVGQRCRQVALACAAAGAGLGALALLGHATGLKDLANFGAESPTAPSTSAVFIAFGAALVLRVLAPSHSLGRTAVGATVLL